MTAALDALSPELRLLGLQLLDWALWMSVWTALLYAGARAVDALTAGRIGPSWRALLYVPVVLRVVLPVRWSSPIAWSGTIALGEVVDAPIAALPVAGPEAGTIASHAAWSAWIAPIYVVVAVGLLATWLRTRARIARTLAEPLSATDEGAPVVASDGYGPAVVGLVRPCIAVPRVLAHSLPSEALDWVVRHERAHVERRDHLVLAAVQVVTVALWPLLPVWLAASRVRALLELACDQTTLEGCAARERRSYQETLLMLASHNTRRVVPRTVPAFGGGSLVERVRGARSSTSLPGAFQAVVVVGAALLMTACTGLADEDVYHVGDDDAVLLSIKSHGLEQGASDEPRQVLLETAVITTDAESSDWILHSVNQESGDVVMELLAEDSRARILVCPSLIALEGQEATVFVGESRRVLQPPADAPSEVKPVTVELDGQHDEFVMHDGVKLQLVTHGVTDGTRPVRIRFVRMNDGKLEHELQQDVELKDGRRILLRVHKAVE